MWRWAYWRRLPALALLLSSGGIYGLVSNLINQRTRELGIRMALGCTVRGAMFEVSRTGMAATGAGLAAGLLSVVCGGEGIAQPALRRCVV